MVLAVFRFTFGRPKVNRGVRGRVAPEKSRGVGAGSPHKAMCRNAVSVKRCRNWEIKKRGPFGDQFRQSGSGQLRGPHRKGRDATAASARARIRPTVNQGTRLLFISDVSNSFSPFV